MFNVTFTEHEIAHIENVLPSQSLGLVLY